MGCLASWLRVVIHNVHISLVSCYQPKKKYIVLHRIIVLYYGSV